MQFPVVEKISFFSEPSTQAVWSNQLLSQMVLEALFFVEEWSLLENEHSPVSDSDVKNDISFPKCYL
jgi:hypothetical protein